MTSVLERPHVSVTPGDSPGAHSSDRSGWLQRPLWNRFTPLQTLVVAAATIAPVVVIAAIGAGLLGVISTETMMDLALAAGENPGTITFGAMFLASPVQWRTGRSQVRVRKHLGIVFFLLALSNGAMFVLESGLASALSAPFLVAGTIAVALAAPLFLTSNRRSQRRMGMQRWRVLHKLTYLVAAGLLAHVLLIPDFGPGALMIIIGFISRIPVMRRRLTTRPQRM